jgi:hypothetical protein
MGRGDRHQGVRAVERLVGEAVILATEHDGDRSVAGAIEQACRHVAWRGEVPLVAPAAGAERGDMHTVGECLVERLDAANAFDDVVRVVGDPLDAVRGEIHRPHEIEVADPHVLHRTHGGGDVDRVLRFEQHHADAVQE